MNPTRNPKTNATKITRALHLRILFSFISLTKDEIRLPPAEARLGELAPLPL